MGNPGRLWGEESVMRRSGLRFVVRLIPVVVLIAGVTWLWTSRLDVSTISQSQLHEEATVSQRVALVEYPKEHEVLIQPLSDDRVLPVLASYLPPPLGSGGKSERQGYYDPKDGRIEITGGLARLSAAMPNPMLRAFFGRALRHEYGHAYLDDWMKAKKADERAWVASLQNAQSIDTSLLPAELQGPVEEYRSMSGTAYGQPYFMSTFSEFMAESYSRLLGGQEVPPKTEQFLMASAGS